MVTTNQCRDLDFASRAALLGVVLFLAGSPLRAQLPTGDTNYRTYFRQKLSVDPGEQVVLGRACCLVGPIDYINLDWSPGQGGTAIREWQFFNAAGRPDLGRRAWWHHAGGLAGNDAGRLVFSASWLVMVSGVASIVQQFAASPPIIRNGYALGVGLIVGGAGLAVGSHFLEKLGDRLLTTNAAPRDTARAAAAEHNRRLRSQLRLPDDFDQ